MRSRALPSPYPLYCRYCRSSRKYFLCCRHSRRQGRSVLGMRDCIRRARNEHRGPYTGDLVPEHAQEGCEQCSSANQLAAITRSPVLNRSLCKQIQFANADILLQSTSSKDKQIISALARPGISHDSKPVFSCVNQIHSVTIRLIQHPSKGILIQDGIDLPRSVFSIPAKHKGNQHQEKIR